MGDAGESEEVREVRMRPITTKKDTHVLLDLFKNSSMVSPRLLDFGKFLLNNKRIINKFVAIGWAEEKKNKKGLNLKLNDIVRNVPNLLDFENKRTYFLKEMAKRNAGHRRSLDLTIDRNNFFEDAFKQLEQISPAEFKRKLNIKFQGERGIDAGGVTRDFYSKIS
jgi:E3 ubiquitin-protein ligase HUWE1